MPPARSSTGSRSGSRRGAPAPGGRRRGTGGQTAPTAPPWWRGAFARGLAVGVLVTAIVALPVGRLGGGSDPIEEAAAEFRRAEAVRDKQQITELTTLARQVQGELVPVLEGMAAAMPLGADTGPGEPASAETAAAWEGTIQAVRARFGDPPSGSTGFNVARSSLVAAVEQLDGAARTYRLGLEVPAAQRPTAIDRAAAQRDLAVRTWSIAATQLDAVNVDAGNGHQHVYLPAQPGSGALTPDPAPEGSEATP